MTQFAIRIELHHKSESAYAILHQKMAAAGYSRSIRGDNGITYQLPSATYVRDCADGVTAQQVYNHAHAVAATVDQAAWTFVVRWDQAYWNLGSPISRAAA